MPKVTISVSIEVSLACWAQFTPFVDSVVKDESNVFKERTKDLSRWIWAERDDIVFKERTKDLSRSIEAERDGSVFKERTKDLSR